MMIAYTYLVNIHSMLVVVSTLFDLLFQVINCFFGQKLFDTTQEIYFQSCYIFVKKSFDKGTDASFLFCLFATRAKCSQ